MIKFLSKLQSKSYHTRVMIMWVAVFVCMVLIFGFWLWSFNRSVKLTTKEEPGRLGSEIAAPLKQLKKEVPSLWQSLGAGIKSLFEQPPKQDIPVKDEAGDEQKEGTIFQEPEPAPEPEPARLPEIR